LGSQFIPVSLDISDFEAVKNWVNQTFSENKVPDILINNAGAGSFGKIDEMPSEEWHAMINTNLNGMYYITSQIASLMKKKKEGAHIVNIGSILGSMGRAESAAYCATKYGVQGFSDALFKELRFFNIKVTCFNPGSIDTHFFESSGIAAHSNMLHPQDLANTLVHILQTPDNMLISDITLRPLNPKNPEN
jgi:NADP-dependent 3-hydroxy acid dehydrogenase YdfG